MWRAVRTTLAEPLRLPCGAGSKPGGDTAGQDALHSAGVEGPEDSGARSKLPQPSQEEETRDVPSSALHLCEQTM